MSVFAKSLPAFAFAERILNRLAVITSGSGGRACGATTARVVP
jgi:hypothetical protein